MTRNKKRVETSVVQAQLELDEFVSLATEETTPNQRAKEAIAAAWLVSMLQGKGGAS
mgnify:CR=1 FL=1